MDESEQRKRVYAYFGRAMNVAQNLEYTIVSAMVALDFVPKAKGTAGSPEEAEQRFDAFVKLQLKDTLGTLIKAIRAVTRLPDELAAALDKCNRKRNWLAHHFFRERADAFMTEQGRAQMVVELRQVHDLFTSTLETFERTMQPAWDRLGVTEEHVQGFTDNYIRQLRDDAGK
jgi:hypothetical protein